MRIIFSPHAKERMKERGIGKSVVFQTIKNPDDIVNDKYKGRSYLKSFGEKTLKVPVIEQKNDIIIKSVFFIK